MSKPSDANDWQIFDIPKLMEKVVGPEPRYHEYLNVPSMSSAVYHLPVGCKDMQSPHLEDEMYVVLEGKASLRIGDKEHEVKKGSILYVRANKTHSFFNIEEDLTVLAFFGPIPGTL